MPYKASTLKPHVIHRPRPRLSAKERGYDRDHRAIRKLVLARDPICRMCGRAPSSHADHKITIRERPDLRFDLGNLQGVCASCHSRKTAAKDHGFGNK